MVKKRTRKRIKRKSRHHAANMVAARVLVKASWDSAQTNDQNRRHWAGADQLAPNAAITPAVRRTLRARSRYEVANNTYAKGIVDTLANYIVGTGPRLQMQTPDKVLNAQIEAEFAEWSAAVSLPQTLKTVKQSETASGEAFVLMQTNKRIKAAAKLSLKLIEADQIATPWPSPVPEIDAVEGIESDESGFPLYYHVLRAHPGDLRRPVSLTNQFDRVPASAMLHLFKADRPGQKRGVPELTPALPLFALLRRYTLAAVSAAEAAALPSGVIQTDGAADGDVADIEPLDQVPMDRNTWLTLPHGWKIGQFKAEHPTTTYPAFKNELLKEIARAVNMPFNIAAGSSEGYNYASGRLDHQGFLLTVAIEQNRMVNIIVNPIFDAWMFEMVRISGLLPPKARQLTSKFPHRWFWDGPGHVDPAKEAMGQEKRLLNGTTNLAIEYGKIGKDWLPEIEQRGKEIELMRELGIPIPTSMNTLQEDETEDERVGQR